MISKDILKILGIEHDDEIALELKKALYGLKQAGQVAAQKVGGNRVRAEPY